MDRGILKFSRSRECKELYKNLKNMTIDNSFTNTIIDAFRKNECDETLQQTLKTKRQVFVALNFENTLFKYFMQLNPNLTFDSKIVLYTKKMNMVNIFKTLNVNNKEFKINLGYKSTSFKKLKNRFSKINFIEIDFDKHELFDVYQTTYKTLISLCGFENIFVYKQDEVFLDLVPILKKQKMELNKFVKTLQKTLLVFNDVKVKMGIGTNMVSAKFALDLYTNKENNYIKFFDPSTYQQFLQRNDFENIWSFDAKMTQLLIDANINTLEQFMMLPPRSVLKILGTKGSEIQNNIKLKDKANWKEKNTNLILNLQNEILNHLKPEFKTISKSKTFEPTNDQELISKYVYENVIECCKKMVEKDILSRTVKIQIYYENFNKVNFICQKTIIEHTNSPEDIYQIAQQILLKHKNCKKQVKRVVVSVDNLIKNQGQKPQLQFDFERFNTNAQKLTLNI